MGIISRKHSASSSNDNAGGAKRSGDVAERTFKNPDPGPFVLPETSITGHILRVDTDGFGIVEFDHDVGKAQLGFFTVKTELVKQPSTKITVGASVTGVIDAVDMQIPENSGPLTLP